VATIHNGREALSRIPFLKPWPASALGTNIALTLLGGFLVVLSWHLGIEFDHFVIGYSETSLCALVTFLGAALLVTRQPVDRATLPIILVIAVLCRLALLQPEPHLSSDIYRYVWDGMVQHHGINPYRYVPCDAHLSSLRDDDIFPNINRRDYAPTIYPPVAQMLFFLATFFGSTLTAMKIAMYLCEAVTIVALIKLLKSTGQRSEQVLLYAWSPLVIWEIGSSGHVDALMTAFIALALLFRFRHQPVLTGLALGAAVLTKFYPLLLFPALWRKWDWKMPLAMLAVCLTYVPYLGVGKRVFGFASGYAEEEGLKGGWRYFLLDVVRHQPGLSHMPTNAFYVFCAICLGIMALWALRISDQAGAAFLSPAAALAFALMLFFSPHYPWYVIWLLPFIVLVPSLGMGVYVCTIFYAFTTQWAAGDGVYFLEKWMYGATALALALQLAWSRWPAAQIALRSLWPVPEKS
jgi:alpha-1,6-mannosyltransferase